MTSVTSGPQSLLPPLYPQPRGEGLPREGRRDEGVAAAGTEFTPPLPAWRDTNDLLQTENPDSLPLMCDDGVIIFLTEESRLLTAGGNEFSTVLRADWPRTGEKLENLIKSGGS